MSVIRRSPRAVLAGALVALIALFAFTGSASASSRGATTLKLDPGTAAALTSLGVSVAPVPPASAGADGVSFPITRAALRFHPLGATIDHSGGLALSAGATTVSLTDYTISLNRAPGLVATVNGGPRVRILNLDLSNLRVGLSWRGLVLRNVKATLTAEAAGALNSAFGTTAITPGLPLGVATVRLRLF